MKTLGKFVLVDNRHKREMVLDWDLPRMNHTQGNLPTPMNYNLRKTLISDLHPALTHPSTAKSLKNNNHLTTTSTKHLSPFVYSNTKRERPSSQAKSLGPSLHYRSRSVRRVSSQQPLVLPKANLKEDVIREKVIEADKKKGKMISAISMRRNGLRFKIKHHFLVLDPMKSHEDFVKEVKAHLFEEFVSFQEKRVYLFHLGKDPIYNIGKDLSEKEFVIFADTSPKFNLPFELQMKLFEQASHLEERIRFNIASLQQLKNEFETEIESEGRQQEQSKHQWQKISSVNDYVNRLIDNPEMARQLATDEEEADPVREWCGEKAVKQESQEAGKGQKNPFFDISSHFPQETTNRGALIKAAYRVDALPETVNKHEVRVRVVENMMEKIKRESEVGEELKRKEEARVRLVGFKSEKEFLRELEHKNSPLIRQNIPYIMEKYGITRSEAYNLYNLYKSLQKISGMRLFEKNEFRRVQERGIDRKTFDEGLKGLEINPGEELIRNICYFPEFISWEEFIKIVSISMRKTPMSKLEALLEGLGNSQDGNLSRQEIDIMVGSSLLKIFGKEDPELREHFVGVVMKAMDKDGSGTIEIQEIKDYVIKQNLEDMDLITYLMLNS